MKERLISRSIISESDVPWTCHGHANAMPWPCHGHAMAMSWQCHGNAMVADGDMEAFPAQLCTRILYASVRPLPPRMSLPCKYFKMHWKLHESESNTSETQRHFGWGRLSSPQADIKPNTETRAPGRLFINDLQVLRDSITNQAYR